VLAVFLIVPGACTSASRAPARYPDADYLYVWAAAADTARGSFLAVYDLARAGDDRLVRIVPAEAPSQGAHHIEHELGGDALLFANAFRSGRTLLFDVSEPKAAHLVTALGDVGPYSHPHSYVRLPDGNRLATFQWKAGGKLPGGLVELADDGKPIRWASAAPPGPDSLQIVPYSLAVLPDVDRVVTTSTHMIEDVGVHVQIWRLSDLALLHTLPVPLAPQHGGHDMHDAQHHRLPGEPRVLADGRTVMFGTFTCGLYHVTGIDGPDPQVKFTHAFPGADCAVPVVIGRYWVQTVPALHGLVALDVTDPARPREAARLEFGADVKPHWLGADATGRRLVTTSASPTDPTLHFIDIDPATGKMTHSGATEPITMRGLTWPDGYRGDAIPHGVVFGARPNAPVAGE
jgi:hypothetical protein